MAAIAVVRLTGLRASDFLSSYFDRDPIPLKPTRGILRSGTDIIDDPVVVLSSDGNIADINLHGGAWVVKATLELARQEGFEVVTDSAGVAGIAAIDAECELEREVISYLPMATTRLAISSLLAQEDAWRDLKAHPPDVQVVQQLLADRRLHWLLHPPRVAIVGAENVGKSTLANQLFAQERSITADVPGTTRDWVGELANIDGLVVTLIDTPGVRHTSDEIERQAIDRAVARTREADLVMILLDV